MDQARTRRGLIGAFALGASLLGLAPFSVHAAWETSSNPNGSTRVTDAFTDLMRRPTRVIDTPVGGGASVQVADEVVDSNGRRIGPITGTRSISAASLARSMFRFAGGPWGLAAQAAAAAAWCKFETGSLLCDNRQPQSTQQYQQYSIFVTDPTTGQSVQRLAYSPAAACQLLLESVVSGIRYVSGSGVNTTGVLTSCPANAQGAVIAYVTVTQVISNCTVNCTSTQNRTSQSTPSLVTTALCPAVPNFQDPVYQVPGGPPDADGKCPTGNYGGRSETETVDRVKPRIVPGLVPGVVEDATRNAPEFVDAEAEDIELTGPGSVQGPSETTTTTGPGGATTTETTGTRWDITYEGDTITIIEVRETTGSDGTTRTEERPNQPPPELKIETCGLPGKPACKIDETGTPVYSPPPTTGLPTVGSDAVQRDTALGGIVTPSFGFVGAPPLAQCSPYVFENGAGTINPCGVVDTVREIMAYLWPLVAVWLCLGMIRKTVGGGA